MPNFSFAPETASASEKAVNYALYRVVSDRNFAHYMWGTETMALLLTAEAQRQGVTPEVVNEQLTKDAQAATPRLVKQRRDQPDVAWLRKRLDAIDELLGRMSDRGKLDDENYTKLCDYIHRDPNHWKTSDAA